MTLHHFEVLSAPKCHVTGRENVLVIILLSPLLMIEFIHVFLGIISVQNSIGAATVTFSSFTALDKTLTKR